MITSAKITTIIAWILIIVNYIYPLGGSGSTFNVVLFWTGIGLAGAHLIEALVFLPKAKRVGGNLALHFVQLFIFGYVHNMVMDEQLKAQAN